MMKWKIVFAFAVAANAVGTPPEPAKATVSAKFTLPTKIEFSAGLRNPHSQDYPIAAGNIIDVFQYDMEKVADNIDGMVFESMTVLSFSDAQSMAQVVITAVFSAVVADPADLTNYKFEDIVQPAIYTGFVAAITNSKGKYVSNEFDRITMIMLVDITEDEEPISQTNGVIEYLWMDAGYPDNAEEEWQIDAACDEVRVISTHLQTEGESDFVYVDGRLYSGDAEIDQIVARSSFTVKFTSDQSYGTDGFRLEWSCTDSELICAPEGWKDSQNVDCQAYHKGDLCGQDYSAYEVDGYHNKHCRECGCVKVEAPAECNEFGFLPLDYRGTVSQTVSGKTCLNWNSGLEVGYSDNDILGIGDHNYCRSHNVAERQGAWCFIEDGNWENCAGTCPAVFQSGDCYENSSGKILSFSNGESSGNTPSRCVTACEGYAYAGVENGRQCQCGNTLPEMTLQRPGECSMECAGNKNEICGGAWLMNIYDTGYPCNPNVDIWTDSNNMDCSIYKDNGHCTADGKYGKQWKEDWGTWEIFAKDGFHAGNCPECGCGGNKFEFKSDPAECAPEGWTDFEGLSCAEYLKDEYCGDSLNVLQEYAKDGFHGGQCVECGCVPPAEDEGPTDECLRELHDCDSTQRCQDTLDFYVCVDMDECLYNMHNCDSTEECTNTIGSFTCSPIIGVWSEWTEYTPCSYTCGPGLTTRERVCEDGVDCEGLAKEGKDCEDKPCPIDECLKELHDCDSTQRCLDTLDTFECVDMDECFYGTHNCASTDECTNTIGGFTCSPIIGVWGEWTEYTPCSYTCGPGIKLRQRVCENGVDCEGLDMDGQDCEDKPCASAEFNPCPNTECWIYDSSDESCSMIPACATLTCSSTAFDVSFKSALFNLVDQTPVTFVGGITSPSWDGSQWTTNVPLGLNGMTYEIDSQKNEITMSIKFAIDGSEDNVAALGSQSVLTAQSAAVVFTCTYSMTVEVASGDYTVTGASVVDTVHGVGTLAAGFAIELNNGEGAAFMLGTVMPVAITWSVTGLSKLTFNIQECTVQHGTTIVMIIKGGCYSATLSVNPEDADARQAFTYQVFKGAGETDPNQTITCKVNICESGKCINPTANSQCPSAGDDQHYGYRV